MALSEITRPTVLAAIAEYDELGREAFLGKYSYGEARGYYLHHSGKAYDSKAIVGVAHGYLPGRPPLEASEFSGGEQTVARQLRRLGFTVTPNRAPAWVRDEVILVCDLVRENGWRWLSATDPRVEELSSLLQSMPIHPPEVRGPKFRNSNGVARKSADIATYHPSYGGRRTKGGSIDREVLEDFLARPNEMHAAALAIRAGVESGALAELPVPVDELDAPEAVEGRLLARQYFARERDSKLREKKIRAFLRHADRVTCEVCGFDFEATYGARGAGYIECHHSVPLHESGETTTRLTDLILLCANCHRMIHRTTPWLTPDELRSMIMQDAGEADGASAQES